MMLLLIITQLLFIYWDDHYSLTSKKELPLGPFDRRGGDPLPHKNSTTNI